MTNEFDTKNEIDYPAMIDDAMRSVVHKCLTHAAKDGLPGEHHFFLSFDTTHPAVQISAAIRQRFPEEMTIVIQHQFWDLNILPDHFSIMLSFNNIPEKLVIPYASLTAFADPSVKFGLQFHNHDAEGDDLSLFEEIEIEMESDEDIEASFEKEFAADASNEDNKDGEQASAEVLSLDAFRKK